MGLWGSFGSGFQRENLIPNIPTIPKTSPEAECEACSRDFRDSRYKVSILKNAQQGEVPAHTPNGEGGMVPPSSSRDGPPDYAAFCPRYWQGCFECPDFMPEMIRFCRVWNRAHYGVDVVDLVTEEDKTINPSAHGGRRKGRTHAEGGRRQ